VAFEAVDALEAAVAELVTHVDDDTWYNFVNSRADRLLLAKTVQAADCATPRCGWRP
jgi:hypothetical protein